MSFQLYHWKRNNHADANEDDYELVKGSPLQGIQAMITNANKDSPLSLLNGFEESILPHILSYSDHAIVPCTCCPKSSPVAFCCRRQRRVLRDLTKKTTEPPKSGANVSLEEYCSEFLWHMEDLSVLYLECGPTHGTAGPWDAQTEESYHANLVKYGSSTYLAVTERGVYSREMAMEWNNNLSSACFGRSKCGKILHIGNLSTEDDGSTTYKGFLFFFESKALVQKLVKLLQRAKGLQLDGQHQQPNSPVLGGKGPVLRESCHLINML